MKSITRARTRTGPHQGRQNPGPTLSACFRITPVTKPIECDSLQGPHSTVSPHHLALFIWMMSSDMCLASSSLRVRERFLWANGLFVPLAGRSNASILVVCTTGRDTLSPSNLRCQQTWFTCTGVTQGCYTYHVLQYYCKHFVSFSGVCKLDDQIDDRDKVDKITT